MRDQTFSRALTLFSLLLYLGINAPLAIAQQGAKKAISHEDVDQWRSIVGESLSSDGRYVAYERKPNLGDGEVVLVDARTGEKWTFPRGSRPQISADSRFMVFNISPPFDTLRAMRRRGVKKDSLPPNTLGLYDIEQDSLLRIHNVNGYSMPEKWSGWIAYEREDSVAASKKKKEKLQQVVFKPLPEGEVFVFNGVSSYVLAEEAPRALLAMNPADSGATDEVVLFDGGKKSRTSLLRGQGKFSQLAMAPKGNYAGFLADRDTTEAKTRPQELFFWSSPSRSAQRVAGPGASFLPEDWRISEKGSLKFSDDGSKLYFGMAPPPILQDSTLLDEEIVQVEVWSYKDKRLYTQQEVEKEEDENRTYTAVLHTSDRKLVPLADEKMPQLLIQEEGNANLALGVDQSPYQLESSWEAGPTCRDIYYVNLKTGMRDLLDEAVCGYVRLSPDAHFAYWYSNPDSVWYARNIADGTTLQISSNEEVPFYDELNDRPMHPSDYGIAGWTENDAYVLLYDRYDIWRVDPEGREAPKRLTKGRESRRTYRYVGLDPDAHHLYLEETWLLHMTDDSTRREGYAWLEPQTGNLYPAQDDNFSYSRRVTKAREAQSLLFTREDFNTFPDLLYSDDRLKTFTKLSNANPRQSEFNWGSIERHFWTSANGERLEGLLIKPGDFDPKKKYPTIVYFYERNSQTLHNYRSPEHHRSTINFAVYASRGYVIFVPDIPYQIGYPGKSAYDAVMPGITSLLDQGYIDKDRIGVQGHSWGGYQSAYLITQTDLFACAESGAPVVNMISAYGGIRWGSGYSRMFQYEQTQSRIGGTLWEYPMRYIENSPIFYANHINTPVLILHNDHDTAVPWYQGIEFFVAMRRLGKPAWMLNYNDEPHWPLKYQNRKDFQHRMQQFFDHYLMDGPLPVWMEEGVPPLLKGIEQGFEPVNKEVSDQH